jgi:hypothetical protein
MSKERLSERQIAALKHLAICCANGGQVTLTRDQRVGMPFNPRKQYRQ